MWKVIIVHDPANLESCVQELSRRIEVGRLDFRLMMGGWPAILDTLASEISTWRQEIRTEERDQAMHLLCIAWLARTEAFQL